jgi:hypothetical protein
MGRLELVTLTVSLTNWNSWLFLLLKFQTAVLDQVKDGWEFIIDPDVSSTIQIPHRNSYLLQQFNNVDLALQLLDDSSLGKDMDSFRRTKEMLGRALKGSVDSALIARLRH